MLVQLEDWRTYVKEGDAFLRTALAAAVKRPGVFTPEILYNLACMAIEKHIMGYLMFHGDLAENHTMRDLARALERHAGPQPELTPELLFLDSLQELCDMQHFTHRPPTPAELERTLTSARKVAVFVTTSLASG